MRIAVIALRNAADARMNTSRVTRPSHSSLSLSVIITSRARLTLTRLLLGRRALPRCSARVSNFSPTRQRVLAPGPPACCPASSQLPALNCILHLIVLFEANQLDFESAISRTTRVTLSFQVPRFSLFGSGSVSDLPATRPELSDVFPHRGFCTASTSLSPLPLENTGLLIVPPIRKGNCNLPSFNTTPDSRATVLVRKLSLVVISANPR